MSGYENGGNPFGQMGGGGDVNVASQLGELVAKVGELSQKIEETRMMGESKSAENARQIAEIRENLVRQEAAAAGQDEIGGMGDVEAPPAEDEMDDILTGVEEDGGEIVEGGEEEGDGETVPEEEVVEEGVEGVEDGEEEGGDGEEEEEKNDNTNKDELGRPARMRGKKPKNKLGKNSLGAAGPIISNLTKQVNELTKFNKNVKKELEKEQQARMLDNRQHDAKVIVNHEVNMGNIAETDRESRAKYWVELKNPAGNLESLSLLSQSLPQLIATNDNSVPVETPPTAMGASGGLWKPKQTVQRMTLQEAEASMRGGL